MTIAFLHNNKAFLPEIEAYKGFFARFGINGVTCTPGTGHAVDATVEWFFMGLQPTRKKNMVTIHEYASASMPPWSVWKDRIKKMVNARPDYRIFNNDYVSRQFAFRDGVPYGIRDYGTRSIPAQLAVPEKKYDFIYAGATDKNRRLEPLFAAFARGRMRDHSLLVVSRDYRKRAASLSGFSNIQFTGPLPPAALDACILQSRYALNFMPDRIPFNRQTSAKMLDYLACGIPVVSTDYQWVREFKSCEGGNYFFLEKDLSNFTWQEVTRFPYAFPVMDNRGWEQQIRRSGVLPFLQSQFPEISF